MNASLASKVLIFSHPNTPNRKGNHEIHLPEGFNLARAQELATLVNAAYNQFNQGPSWVIPAGYKLVATLSAREVWKELGPLANLIPPQMIPMVPFGFVA